jgi:hypothetical protein
MITVNLDGVKYESKNIYELPIGEFIQVNRIINKYDDLLDIKTVVVSFLTGIKVEDLDEMSIEDLLNVFEILTELPPLKRESYKGFTPQEWNDYSEIKISRKVYEIIKNEMLNDTWNWISKLPELFFTNNGVQPDNSVFIDAPATIILPYVLKVLDVIQLQMKFNLNDRKVQSQTPN